MESLVGSVCVVTGGASGLGLALAQRFARDGAQVTVADEVVEAVLHDRFWIISHGGMEGVFEARYADVRAAWPAG